MSEYEFSSDENRAVGSLARVSRISGMLNIVLAVALVVVAVKVAAMDPLAMLVVALDAGAIILTAVLLCLFGIWLIRAAALLSQIVTTQGSDVTLLMAAFKQLAKIYRTQFWLWMIGIILIAISIIFRIGIHIARN